MWCSGTSITASCLCEQVIQCSSVEMQVSTEYVPPVLLYRGVRGSLQQCFLFGPGEKLRPPAGHRRGGLQGEHLGCEQGQLHHGETSTNRPRWICVRRSGLSLVYCCDSELMHQIHFNPLRVCLPADFEVVVKAAVLNSDCAAVSPLCVCVCVCRLSESDWSQEPSGVCPVQHVRGTGRCWIPVWINTSLGPGGCQE